MDRPGSTVLLAVDLPLVCSEDHRMCASDGDENCSYSFDSHGYPIRLDVVELFELSLWVAGTEHLTITDPFQFESYHITF